MVKLEPQADKHWYPKLKDQLGLMLNPIKTCNIMMIKVEQGDAENAVALKDIEGAAGAAFAYQLTVSANLLMGTGFLIALRFTKADRARTLISRTVGVSMVVFSLVPTAFLCASTRFLSTYNMKQLNDLAK